MKDESQICCGNGCNTCVLDEKAVQKDLSNLENVIESRYNWFTVSDIQQEADFVFSLEFKCDQVTEDSSKGLYIPSGCHLMMRLPSDHIPKDVGKVFSHADLSVSRRIGGKSRENKTTTNDPETIESYFSRPYSPYQSNSKDLSFKILFRYEGGEMSQRIIRLNIGDSVEWKGFYSGGFNYSRNMTRNLICICQGVAIAPMVNIIQQMLDDEDDETLIHLIGCFRDFSGILLKPMLRTFMNYWNFKLTLYLPHHLAISCPDTPSNCRCRERHKMFTETVYLSRMQLETFNDHPQEAIYLISGSEEFLQSTSDLLNQLSNNKPRDVIKLVADQRSTNK